MLMEMTYRKGFSQRIKLVSFDHERLYFDKRKSRELSYPLNQIDQEREQVIWRRAFDSLGKNMC